MIERIGSPFREQRSARVASHVALAAIFAALPLVAGSTAFAQDAAAGGPPPPAAVPPPAPAEAPPPAAAPAKPTSDKPWRAYEALGAPVWLRFGLEQRTRFENLQNDFHDKATGHSRALALRTLLSAELRVAPLVVGAEVMDGRAYANDETPLNTTILDPLDVLQAYAGLRFEGLLAKGDSASVTVGRMTIDIGSRRAIARNEFRNTINTYTGVDARWACPRGHAVRAFAVVPVLRFPADSDTEGLEDNRIKLDRENWDALVTGIFFSSAPLAANLQLEAYVYGVHERDVSDAPSANRRIFTPGARLLRPPAAGQFDFQVEAMGQFGTSRASTKDTDTKDLRHRAAYVHVSGGRKFAAPWSPRVSLHWDYATGDRNKDDGVNGRFDPLFGARRFEFGPSGLYGAWERSNLNSPGLRIEVAPHKKVDAFAMYRPFWLASSRDFWTKAKLRDPTGESGSFVGQQIEARVRWNVLPKNLAFDVGAAYLAPGRFMKDAPGGRDAPPFFTYAQVTGTI